MARSQRQVPNIYFGRPGNLVTLPWPLGDIDRTYDRPTFDFLTGSGQHQISTLATGSRPYTLNWNALHVDTYARLEQFWTGNMGTGPWALVDPSLTNLLLPNQASATSLFNDARHWTTSATDNGTPKSNSDATYIHRSGAPRSLRWHFTVTPATTPQLKLSPAYRAWYGIPVYPGLPYSFSFWVRTDGVVDSSISLFAQIDWLTKSGSSDSVDTTGFITATNTWTNVQLTGFASSNAGYLLPSIKATGSSIITGASLYIDEPIVEQDFTVNPWAPGAGMRPVEMLGLTEKIPFDGRIRQGITLTLRELAQ